MYAYHFWCWAGKNALMWASSQGRLEVTRPQPIQIPRGETHSDDTDLIYIASLYNHVCFEMDSSRLSRYFCKLEPMPTERIMTVTYPSTCCLHPHLTISLHTGITALMWAAGSERDDSDGAPFNGLISRSYPDLCYFKS